VMGVIVDGVVFEHGISEQSWGGTELEEKRKNKIKQTVKGGPEQPFKKKGEPVDGKNQNKTQKRDPKRLIRAGP